MTNKGLIRSSVSPPYINVANSNQGSTKASIDEKTRQLFAHHLLRIGFSVKFTRYLQCASEQITYEEIFRSQDVPIPLFLKAILLGLQAQHLLLAQEKTTTYKRSSHVVGKWSFLKQ